jgi:hypothetical protein
MKYVKMVYVKSARELRIQMNNVLFVFTLVMCSYESAKETVGLVRTIVANMAHNVRKLTDVVERTQKDMLN